MTEYILYWDELASNRHTEIKKSKKKLKTEDITLQQNETS